VAISNKIYQPLMERMLFILKLAPPTVPLVWGFFTLGIILRKPFGCERNDNFRIAPMQKSLTLYEKGIMQTSFSFTGCLRASWSLG